MGKRMDLKGKGDGRTFVQRRRRRRSLWEIDDEKRRQAGSKKGVRPAPKLGAYLGMARGGAERAAQSG